MLATPGLETPRGVQDRPGINSVGGRADEDSPNARRIASHPDPDIAENTRCSSRPRSQALLFWRSSSALYTSQTRVPGEMFAPARRIPESPITVTKSSSSRSQSAGDDGPRDVRGTNSTNGIPAAFWQRSAVSRPLTLSESPATLEHAIFNSGSCSSRPPIRGRDSLTSGKVQPDWLSSPPKEVVTGNDLPPPSPTGLPSRPNPDIGDARPGEHPPVGPSEQEP